ncbi:hypothetical protein [Priestia megaterium]|uniref:hypothetical protein n=1 Tax=Priestia megaterium TaxID=1404 RepID=UPI0028774F82|nr:hypothetical protein [Priestia megaterium]
MPIKNRSDKHKNNKIIKYSIVSVLSIIIIVFAISAVNSAISFTESLATKPEKTTHVAMAEESKKAKKHVEKQKQEENKTEEKEPKQIPVNDVSSDSETVQNDSTEEEGYSYTYTIDSVQNNEIYATSMQEGQVYFTQSLVKDNAELNVGDTVLVNFESNEMDSITSVELVFAVNDYQTDQEEEQTGAEIQNDKAFDELQQRTEELKKEVNKNYEAVTGNKDTSYNVKEVTIESIDNGEYTASNGVTFTSDEVYNGIEFEEGDNATVIYDDNGNLFEVNDGIMSDDGSYISPSFN